MTLPGAAFISLSVAVWLCAIYLRARSRRSKLSLPPGPRGLPWIGNIDEFPLDPKRLVELTAQYGDIFHLSIFGQHVIVLNGHEDAVALLDKRGSKYSGRAMGAMVDLTGFHWLTTFVPYGPYWRKIRNYMHQCLGPAALPAYRPIQMEELHRYLLRLLDHPEDFMEHARKMIGTMIIRTMYGIDVPDTPPGAPPSRLIHIAETSMAGLNEAFHPGRHYVQILPWLRYVPGWVPGARFQRVLAYYRPYVEKMLNVAWEKAEEKLQTQEHGEVPAQLSGYAKVLQRIRDETDTRAAKSALASAYFGGADTTLSTLNVFIGAMAMHPAVQKRAQDQLDAVVGPDRLPRAEDKAQLPYICAVAKECMRWRQVVPLSVPHVSAEEDEFAGHRIPSGAAIVTNLWGISMSPKNYENPEQFRPERFLDSEGNLSNTVLDPANFVFGYGRRICPGNYFSEAAIFLMLANVLHTFRIEAIKDGQGNPTCEKMDMLSGVVAHPVPFECIIKPRSQGAEDLIRSRLPTDFI